MKVWNWLKNLFKKAPTEIAKVVAAVPEPVKEIAIVTGKLYLDAASTKFQQLTHLNRLLLCLSAKDKCGVTDVQRLADLDNEIQQRVVVLWRAGVEVLATKESIEATLKKYR